MRTLSLLLVAILACATPEESVTPEAPEAPVGSWEVKADIPYRVQEVYPALHQGRIYLAGGLSPDVAESDGNISDRVYIYDPTADEWSEGPSLPEPRHHPYLVSTGAELFSIGGFIAANGGRWSASTDILRLDDATDSWVKVAELLTPQSETVAVHAGRMIYIATGRAPTGSANAEWTDQGDVASLQVFDTESYGVAFATSSSIARNSGAGAVIDDKLYVVGGRVVGGGNVATNEMFDLQTGEWTTLAPMPNAQGGIAAAALDGRLYVFGGEYFESGGGGVHRESWEYDPSTDTWAEITAMPVPRHGLGAVTVGDEIFVIAGAAQVSSNETTNRLSAFTR
ncbi:MAG: kelch repeat-containing protein [Gemmatimonadota bacterium]